MIFTVVVHKTKRVSCLQMSHVLHMHTLSAPHPTRVSLYSPNTKRVYCLRLSVAEA